MFQSTLILFFSHVASVCWSSGTPLIWISLDGFRSDYLQSLPMPTIRELKRQGASAKSMRPVFPSLTFPNHNTLATGLYVESHGIIANNMADAAILKDFKASLSDPFWWDHGESTWPIWITNEIAGDGRRSAIIHWIGSNVPYGNRWPYFYQSFNFSENEGWKMNQIRDLAVSKTPPNLYMVYISCVDDSGHLYGPNNKEAMTTAAIKVDGYVSQLVNDLKARGVFEETNLLITGDHGMSECCDVSRTIYLGEYANSSLYRCVSCGAVGSIDVLGPDVGAVYSALRGSHPHMTVYLKNEVPGKLHYQLHSRLEDIVAIADPGWNICAGTRSQPIGCWMNRGQHGYYPDLQEMHTVMIGRGPDFARGIEGPVIDNIHVYSLVCHLLDIESHCHPSNGTLSSVDFMLATSTLRYVPWKGYPYIIAIGSSIILMAILAVVLARIRRHRLDRQQQVPVYTAIA